MAGRQKIRSDETKQAILAVSGALFASRGFAAVTMREIATAAGCSHAAIYMYFADKEALLHQLSMGPLRTMREQLESVVSDQAQAPEARLGQVSRTFIRFCLVNRSMYNVLFMARASRADQAEPEIDVQRLRNDLFGLLRRAISECLPIGTPVSLTLAFARIFFFVLHGMMALYVDSNEPSERLLKRLAPTFELTVEVLLDGFKQNANRGAIGL